MCQSNTPCGSADSDANRDPRLAGFASGGRYDAGPPEAGMTAVLEAVSDDSGRPPPKATDDEVVGMMSCWQLIEAHAHARMLAAVREIIRRRVPAGENPAAYPGLLPSRWELGVAHEVAAELRISTQAAAPLVHLAWELEARIPGAGRLLDKGVLTALKAKIVADEFGVLDDDKIAEAEKLLLEEDLAADAMTPGRLRKLCQRIVDTVDADGARKRREAAQRDRARVTFFRAHGGDTALFAEGLPPDAALMAQSNIQARARDYHRSTVYPEARMDLLRVLAMLDLINGVTLDQRIARYHAEDAAAEDARLRAERAADQETARILARCRPGTSEYSWPGDGDGDGDYGEEPPDDDDCDPWPGDPPPGDDPEPPEPPDDGGGGGGSRPGGSGPGAGPRGTPGDPRGPGLPALAHLTLPLATLLGLASRPGEVPGYGSVDPGLVTDFGTAAAASPRSRFCLTVTDSRGHAAGHACAKLIRGTGGNRRRTGTRNGPAPGDQNGPGRGWNLEPDTSRPGPDGGYGAWILSVPGGTRYRLDVHPVPLHRCDHRYATDSYRPGALLRHLVEIRDGECSFTTCSHPARMSDFEHTIPYDQGGATDGCNGSPRSRRCHRVKQSRGWSVTQPEPSRHQWHTPAGRTYEKGPMTYPG